MDKYFVEEMRQELSEWWKKICKKPILIVIFIPLHAKAHELLMYFDSYHELLDKCLMIFLNYE